MRHTRFPTLKRSGAAILFVAACLMMTSSSFWCYRWYTPPAPQDIGTSHPHWIIENVSIVDTVTGTASPPQTVTIKNGWITHISAGENQSNTSTAIRIDARGKYLMPGIIDMHTHVWNKADLYAMLSHGVTRTRVMSGNSQQRIYKKWISLNQLDGPEMTLASAPMNQHSRYASGPHHIFITSVSHARRLVRHQHQLGYNVLKIYDGLTPEIFIALTQEAHSLNMPFAGHPPFAVSLDDFLKTKPQSLEHMEMIFQAPMQYSYDKERLTEIAVKLKETHTPVTPTLLVYDEVARIASMGEAHWNQLQTQLNYLHPVIKTIGRTDVPAIHATRTEQNWVEKSEIFAAMTTQLNTLGVTLLLGSDGGTPYTANGVGTLKEMQRWQQAGIPPADIIRAATLSPAQTLGVSTVVGKVMPSYKAELLILPQNPLNNLAHLDHLEGLFTGSKYYNQRDLARMRTLAQDPMSTIEFYFWWVIDNYLP